MPAQSPHEQREISHNQFRDHTVIHQGNAYYGAPHPPARAEVVRVIPYPRNEDLVHRRDLIDKLDKFLPPTAGSRSAALWGLGGSGKTQIALDYAYRRCDADDECCVFWVHADSEATFLADYKTIGKKLGVDERLDGLDLLDAVRIAIEGRPKWVMILDNADDLRLFGVGQLATGGEKNENQNQNLHKYVPCTSQGTVLWTSRDAHIAGTLVGARYGIEVRSMAIGEATTLLAKVRDEPLTAEEAVEEAGVNALLQEIQRLPLAISQAGAYMRRLSITAEQYLSLLRQDSQDIPHELVTAAACLYDLDDEDDEDPSKRVSELEVLEAIARLKEFSFLSLRQSGDGGRRYEMHKLVQEAIRYGYLTHALRVGEWAEVSGRETETASLFGRVSDFLYDRGRWREKEPVDSRAWGLRREVLGKKHPDTISSMADLASTYHQQGRYDEAEGIYQEVLELRREVVGEKHPDTIRSMADLATTYHAQGRYKEAEGIYQEVLELRREVVGEKHPDTISSMADLASTYHQ
ncbi:hypothetical protein ACHAPI_011354 [Fusarium lateritium]